VIDRSRVVRASPVAALSAALLATGCLYHRHEDSAPLGTATHIVAATSSPSSSRVATAPVATGAPEPLVDLEMVDAPVKLILERLADIGGLQLILPAGLNRTVSVQYIHVPVSVALDDVLKRAGLRLGVAPAVNLPFDTLTVFYRLPANIDSMSVEAIMSRFGLGRPMAELLVRSRRP
jgi:hypothetical protein